MAISQPDETYLLKQLTAAIDGHQAHIDFDSALNDFPFEQAGVKPFGAPHSAWELLEHMRIAQHDILEFSRNPNHQSPKWPEGYWPRSEVPEDEAAWRKSVETFRQDRSEFERLIEDPAADLWRPFTHGKGQTLLREALLIASHNSYHLGQLMYLKRMLTNK